ncbi:MAG: alpha/beta hydrolase [Anaerolineae bacterium]|jgi:pimeloyl-ACP methyl ester carboxylesterase
MSVPTLAGITPKMITTDRITTRVLFSGPEDGVPVLFLHGNASSATWWEENMLALPPGYRGIAPDQRGFGEADFEKKVDATRGSGDWADDAVALLDHLGIDRAHIAGCSLGGCVVWHMLREYPARFLTASLVDAGSPFGFGGTKDVEGTPCYDDYAGSGGGLTNPEFLKLLAAGDRSLDSQASPRAAMRALVFKPPFVPEREEDLLTSMLTTHLGERDNPGDSVPSPNWPYVAPGVWGSANALSPKYVGDVSKLYAAEPKVDVLWVRGSHDLAVADAAASDPGTLGSMGLIPNWPGMEVYPPQPMLGQIRHVLDKYAAAGGSYKEVVIEDAGHTPFVEKPDEFNAVFHAHLGAME